MEWYKTECGKYSIESLSAATFPGALEVMRNAFCQEEAVSVACEVYKNPIAAEEELEICADAALDGVYLVAVAIDTGEVVAAAFNKFLVPASSTEKPFLETFLKRCTQPESRALVEFMIDMDKRCNLLDIYQVDCILEIMYLATLREHRNQKLALHLCKTSIDLARKLKNDAVSTMTVQDLGPKYSHLRSRSPLRTYPKVCSSIWSAKGTQKIGKQLNFQVRMEIPFTEFVYNGKSYAERLGEDVPKFCEIVALALY